jgi:hypothetical protein
VIEAGFSILVSYTARDLVRSVSGPTQVLCPMSGGERFSDLDLRSHRSSSKAHVAEGHTVSLVHEEGEVLSKLPMG